MTTTALHDQRLNQLRNWMSQAGIDVLLISSTDAFLSEYAPPSSQHLKWLTGFSGSTGEALVTQDQALLFVDGRYVEHAKTELSQAYEVIHTADQTQGQWLNQHLQPHQKVAMYGWTLSFERGKALNGLVENKQCVFEALPAHPLDGLWNDRPAEPQSEVVIHPLIYAGQAFEEKLAALRQHMVQKKLDTYILVDANAICWLLNIRGADHPETPLVYSYMVIMATGPGALFLTPRPGMDALKAHVCPHVDLFPLSAFPSYLESLKTGRVGLDGLSTPYAVGACLEAQGCETVMVDDLTAMPRAVKNRVEVSGAHAAHMADGLALIRTFAWIEQQVRQNVIFTEHDIGLKMLTERSRSPDFRMPSFATIAGFGPNGAIMHYRAKEEGSASVTSPGFLLIDSGGQYLTGTTDVTRTFAFGPVRPDQKEAYTRVLKGHIALATAVFPKGTKGWQLDVLARGPLWQAGLDYAHATGHGVGSYLSVHENPMYIGGSSRFQYGFEVGMICSNEPGYYVPGDYGIRIESLMVVEPAPVGGNMLCFRTLTRAPIDVGFLQMDLMDPHEIHWLNTYHARVWADLSPLLLPEEDEVGQWLEQACRPLPQ